MVKLLSFSTHIPYLYRSPKMKKVLWRALSLILCLSILLLPAGVAARADSMDTSAIDAYIAQVMEVMPIPGIAVAVVQGDQVVYQNGYGIAGTDDRPVTSQMPFLIGSVTKCYTAMGIMQLASQGLVSLNEPLATYIPEFHTLDPQISARITLDLLINHRSGFSRLDGGLDMLYDPGFTPADVLEYIAGINPVNPVGTEEYSNLNFILLGIVIERVSSMPYADYIQQNIFDPLEMVHSHFSFESAQADGMAHGYRIMFGIPVPFDDVYSTAQQSAGFAYSSAEDLAHFLIPYFNDGYYGSTRVLEPLRPSGDAGKEGWLGIYLQWTRGTGTGMQQMHEGGTSAANSAIYYDPGLKTGVVVLTNTRINERAVDASGAAVIAKNLLRIATGMDPTIFNDGGFHAFYRTYNLKEGALLLVAILELVISIVLWPRWLNSKRRVARLILYLFIALDALAALAILVGVPILVKYSWITIVELHNDFLILDLVVGILIAGALLAKVLLLLRRPK
jgi:CubicO group peptidase (beta-lactamase class C family)